MEPIVLKTSSIDCKSNVALIHGNYLLRKAENNLHNAYKVPYALNDEEIVKLQSMFLHRQVVVNNLARLKFVDHPIPAALNEYAYIWFAEHLQQSQLHGIVTIEMGGDPRRNLAVAHNCYLMDQRSIVRYTSNTSHATTQHAADVYSRCIGKTRSTICSKGCQECSFPCDEVVSINSIYDVSFEDIAKIFYKHKCTKMIVWMYLPPSILNTTLQCIDDDIYTINFIKNGEHVIFALKDYSFTYDHTLKEWSKWYKYTKISTPDFDIAIEIKASFGTFHQIQLTRTIKSFSPIYRMPPYGVLASKYVKLPDILYFIKRGMVDEMRDMPKVVVPKHIVMKMRNYMSRQVDVVKVGEDGPDYKKPKSGVNWTSYITVLQGTINTIRIGTDIVVEGWKVTIKQFERIALIMFIQGAIQRHLRTNTISLAFAEMKSTRGWWDDMCHNFKLIFNTIDVVVDDLSHEKLDFSRMYDIHKPRTNQKIDQTLHADIIRDRMLRLDVVEEFDDDLVSACYQTEYSEFAPLRGIATVPLIRFPITSVGCDEDNVSNTGVPMYSTRGRQGIVGRRLSALKHLTHDQMIAHNIKRAKHMKHKRNGEDDTDDDDLESGPEWENENHVPNNLSPDVKINHAEETANAEENEEGFDAPQAEEIQLAKMVVKNERIQELTIQPHITATQDILVADIINRPTEPILVVDDVVHRISKPTIQPVGVATPFKQAENLIPKLMSIKIDPEAIPDNIIAHFEKMPSKDVTEKQKTRDYIVDNAVKNMFYDDDYDDGGFLPPRINNRVNIKFIYGDLFEAKRALGISTTAHCVATDGKWSAGIVVQMAKHFGEYKHFRSVKVRLGGCDVVQTNDTDCYWLFTKDQTSGKPTLHSLKSSIQMMLVRMRSKKLIIPMLGCGIDGISPFDFIKILVEECSHTDIQPYVVMQRTEFEIIEAAQSICFLDVRRKRKCQSIPLSFDYDIAEIDVAGLDRTTSALQKEVVVKEMIVKRSKPKVESNVINEERVEDEINLCLIDAFVAGMNINGKNLTTHGVRTNVGRYLLDGEKKFGVYNSHFTKAEARAYLFDGKYNEGFINHVPHLLSLMYAANFNIYNESSKTTTTTGEMPMFTLILKDKHFTLQGYQGGIGSRRVRDKYQEIIDFLKSKHWDDALDISAAPGMLVSIWEENFGKKIAGCVYTGVEDGSSFLSTECVTSFSEVYKYASLNDLNTYHKNIICDAASRNSETFYYELTQYFMRSNCDNAIIKLFPPAREIVEKLSPIYDFEYVRMNFSSHISSEVYLYISKKTNQPIPQFPIYGLQEIDINVSAKEIGAYITDLIKSDIPMIRKLAKKITSMPIIDTNVRMNALFGYAGTGKSVAMVEHAGKTAYYGVPTKVLAFEYQANKVPHVFTQHKLLLNDERKDTIVFDEATQMPLAYFALLRIMNPTARIFVIGDIFQISFIDFSKSFPLGVNKTFKDLHVINTMRVSHRCPQDVVAMLNAKFNIDMVTTSQVVKSIFYTDRMYPEFKDYQVLSMNSSTAAKWETDGFRSTTVHKSEGATYDNVLFCVDDLAVSSGMMDQMQHIYVGASRHRKQFVITGFREAVEQTFCIGGHMLENYADFAGNMLHDEVIQPFANKKYKEIVVDKEDTDIDKFGVNTNMVVSRLRELLPVVNESFPFVTRFVPLTLPPVEQGNMRVKIDALTTVDERCVSHVIDKEFEVLRQAQSRSKREAIETMLARYAQKTKTHNRRERLFLSNKLIESLAILMTGKKNVTKLKRIIADYVTEDKLLYHYKEYLISLQKKIKVNSKSMITVEEIESELTLDGNTIKFFNKKQGKFDPKIGFDMKLKAGQGVMAWEKKLNCVYAAYSRCLVDMLIDLMPDNVILATGESDAVLGERLAKLEERTTKDTKHFKADATQWDASYNDVMIDFDCELFKMMGMNDQMLNLYRRLRVEWRANGPDFCFFGLFMQHSGQPFTFSLNSLLNMLIIRTAYCFENVSYMVFKGDDSDIACTSFNISDIDFLVAMGHSYKVEFDEIGEFAGMFITQYGFFPDIFRRMCKFLSKHYHDQAHFEEAKNSVNQDLNCIMNQSALNAGAIAMEIHYRYLGMTSEDIKLFVSYAHRVSTMHFSDLLKKTTEGQVVSNEKF